MRSLRKTSVVKSSQNVKSAYLILFNYEYEILGLFFISILYFHLPN